MTLKLGKDGEYAHTELGEVRDACHPVGWRIGDHVVARPVGIGNTISSGVVFGFVYDDGILHVVVRWHGGITHGGASLTGFSTPDQLVRVGRPE